MPKIIGTSVKKVQDKAPPEKERTRPHKWLSVASMERYRESEPEGFELYLSKLAEEKIRNHALSCLSPRTEVMGLMLGTLYQHQQKEYVLVRDVVTTDLDASSVSVKFDRELQSGEGPVPAPCFRGLLGRVPEPLLWRERAQADSQGMNVLVGSDPDRVPFPHRRFGLRQPLHQHRDQ